MSSVKLIAFYLPQFHPVPENDQWWGKGFTEWTNVAKAKPLFPGHYQPHIPADLGFYDLRVPEVRQQQAEMAKEAGISAFCYWHYWFGNGKQLLEKPLEEVVRSGEPDFPFCLGWANHSWQKKLWNKSVSRWNNEMLIDQQYPGEEDYRLHFNTMLSTFKDERYFKVDGKLLFLIYDSFSIPDFSEFKRLWNELAKESGLPDFYFMFYIGSPKPELINSDVSSQADGLVYSYLGSSFISVKTRVKTLISRLLNIPTKITSYKKAIKEWEKEDLCRQEKIHPCIFPNWDHSPRIGAEGAILQNSTPELFKKHLLSEIAKIKHKPEEQQLIFIKSWNEWAEGNHLEPDLKYGKGFLDAIREALNES